MALTATQQLILENVKNGHSLLVLGQSGTGKSYLVKEIARALAHDRKTVSITATTGIASLNVGGQTVHSWSGIADGRFTNEDLVFRLNTDENFKKYKNNILTTSCLIIDEISMLSMKLFDQIEYICRKILKNDIVFGGMQVIAVGDFFQLPPVPDFLKNDSGDYCFKSEAFTKIFCHKFILSEVLRQHQPDFIKAINDVSRGDLPKETHDLLHRLSRPLPPGPEPIRLCARNFDCFMYNAMKLIDLEGDEIVYNSVDEGDMSKLEKLSVPKKLHLKIGCPVMLLKNLSVKLVNGLRGTVTGLSKNNVTVNFSGGPNSENVITNFKPETFLLYSCTDGKVVASRQQYPLCLAYSITIHKSQGLTLQRVEVDASNIFAAGQLGVAIGRATEKKGLRVLGFNDSSVIKHDPNLYQFYENTGIPKFDTQGNLGCCRAMYSYSDTTGEHNISEGEIGHDELSDFSDNEMSEIDFLLSPDSDVVEPTHHEPFEEIIDNAQISALFKSESQLAPSDKILSNIFENILQKQPNELKYFVNKLFSEIKDLFVQNCDDVSQKPTEAKTWTKYYSAVYHFSVSETYVSLVKALFQCEPSSQHFEMCSKIFDRVTSEVLKRQSDLISLSNPSPSPIKEMSDSGRGKLRYIFGRCIAKSRFHYMKQSMNSVYKSTHRNQNSKLFLKVKMLDSLTETYAFLENSSKYKETLFQTQRKQNLTNGLTNIKDQSFEFIMKVENKRSSLQNEQTFSALGADLLNYTRNEILNDLGIFEFWKRLFSDFEPKDPIFKVNIEDANECLLELFKDIIERFCKIADNEFRKKLLHVLKKTKTERLRRRVDLKQSASCTLKMNSLLEDKSECKRSSHLKLKSLIFDSGKSCLQNFTKKDLLKLCSAYGIQVSSSAKNDKIKEMLCSIVASSDEITHPLYLNECGTIENLPHQTLTSAPEPAISTFSQSEPASSSTHSESPPCTSTCISGNPKKNIKSRKRKPTKFRFTKKKCKQADKCQLQCPLCEKKYEDGEDWVACDLCDTWYNRQCLNISDDQWIGIEQEDWYCPLCLK